MILIADENIAFAKEAISGFGELKLLNGRSLTNNEVKDSEVLIVRSITKVNQELLKNTKILFVGTATIGTDHIDLDYLKSKKIAFADAKGCNADSVAEYVFTSLFNVASEEKISLREKTIGVVGIGNIGSRIVKLAESFGMKVLKNDPPLERKGIGANYVALDEILKADIITFHVPLNKEGIDKTYHLIDNEKLKRIKSGTVIINTSRGPVIDNNALLKENEKKNFNLIFDVWEDEPTINTKLLEKVKIGTPHISGYSFEGKVNGTKMIYDALCKHLKIKPDWKPVLPKIEQSELRIPQGKTDEEKLYKLFSSIYNLENDDKNLREISRYDNDEQPKYFDRLRKEYPIRREFGNFTVTISEEDKYFKPLLECLRFKVRMK